MCLTGWFIVSFLLIPVGYILFFSAIFICNSFRGFAFTLILPDALILRYLKIKICWTKIRAVFACKCNPVCYNVLRQNLAICATFFVPFRTKKLLFQ